jgi:hypothetical protein
MSLEENVGLKIRLNKPELAESVVGSEQSIL